MNQSHRTPTKVTTILDECAAPRAKHERLALARALVIAQFGPAARRARGIVTAQIAIVTAEIAAS